MKAHPRKCTILLLLALAVRSHAGAVYDGKARIEVRGKGNTLASVAADLARPDVFSYDAKARAANCRASLLVADDGELTVGVKGDPDAGEQLNIVCDPQGARRSYSVEVKGRFDAYHSKIAGVNSQIKPRRSYRLAKALYYQYYGGGDLIDVEIRSAEIGLQIWPGHGHRRTVRNVTVNDCVLGLNWSVSPDNMTTIDGLDLSGSYIPAEIKTPKVRRGPIVVRNAKFSKREIRIQSITDGGSDVMFVNSPIDPNQVWLRGESGRNRLIQARTQYVEMTNMDEQPLNAEIKLRLTSTGPDGAAIAPTAIVQADGAGASWLDMPQRVIVAAKRYGKGYTAIEVTNRLEAAVDRGEYGLVTSDWTCTEPAGWRFARLLDGTWGTGSVPYRPRAAGVDQIVNLCDNGGLEIETIAGFPDCWWAWKFYEMKPGGWGVIRRGKPLVQFGLDHEVFVEGKKSLSLPSGLAVYHLPLTGGGVLKKGKRYVVSFSARSDRPDSEFFVAQWGRPKSDVHFKAGLEWRRFHVVMPEMDATRILWFGNRSVLSFDSPGNGNRLWLDAVQVEEGADLHPFVPDNFQPVEF